MNNFRSLCPAAALGIAFIFGLQATAQQQPLTTSVTVNLSQPANQPAAFAPLVLPMKLVGGGAQTNWSGNGSLLTYSQPDPNGLNMWAAAAKDHLAADPATISVYAIGLLDPQDDYETTLLQVTSAPAPHPTATASLPAGYVMTGGGCAVNWRTNPNAAGNLLTASFPASTSTWECRGKDHAVASPATITAFIIGIRPKRAGLPTPVVQITTARSAVGAHPTAFAAALPGAVLTGGGARAVPADPNGAGQILTASFPETAPGTNTPNGWRVSSKDHSFPSPGTIEAFAVNLQWPMIAMLYTPPVRTLILGQWQDCPECPTMRGIPAGSFMMGTSTAEPNHRSDEEPQHMVRIKAFAAAITEVTWAQWDACVAAGGCDASGPEAAGGNYDWNPRALRPAINLSWHDAQSYVHWLAQRTQKPYRLLTEAEWEYAARAGTTTPYNTGTSLTASQAAILGTGSIRTAPVGIYPPNGFGLFDMHGNAHEWVQDCFASYSITPTDGTAYETPGCAYRTKRGGAWNQYPEYARSGRRFWINPVLRGYAHGMRVGLSLP